MQLNSISIVGSWVRAGAFMARDDGFPRITFRPNGTGVLEDGDFPVPYSSDCFHYEFLAPTVIRFFKVSAWVITDNWDGLEPTEPNLLEGMHDLTFHQCSSGLFFQLDLKNVVAYRLINSNVDDAFQPRWPRGITNRCS